MSNNGKVDFKPWPVLDEAYVAGIVGADGYIGITRSVSKNGRAYHNAQVQISQSYEPLINEIRGAYGGSATLRSGPNWKWAPAWNLVLSGPEAVVLIEAIRPYLRVKAVEAWLVLEFAANANIWPERSQRLSEEEVALREGFHLAAKFARHNRGVLA